MPAEQELRAMYAAWNERGVSGAAEKWHEEIVIHDFPDLPDATVIHGRDEAIEVWEERLKTFELDLAVLSIEELGGNRLFAVVEVHGTGSTTGIGIDEQHFHLVTMREGMVGEVRFFRDRAQAREAAGLPAE